MKKIALFLALACMAFAIHAQEGPAPEGPKPQRPGKGDKQPPQQRMVEKLQKSSTAVIAMYDADKDGTLNDAEKAALAHDIEIAKKLQPYMRDIQIFQKLDANGNMALDPEEAAKIREVMKEMRGTNGPNGPEGRRAPQGARPPRPEGGQQPADAPKPPEAPEAGEVPPPPPAAE